MMLYLLLILCFLFFPNISFNNINCTPNFSIILLLFSVYKFEKYIFLIIAFLIGFVIDVLTQFSLFGINMISFTVFGYFYILIYEIKNETFKNLLILSLIFLFNLVQFSISETNSLLVIFFISLINLLSTLFTYIIISKFFKGSNKN